MKNLKVVGYGLGSFGKDFALGVIGSYLLVFYTDIFGISAAAAGAILFIAKVWDAINDPIMGGLADRSKFTRWGRYRPYILLVSIPLAVFSVLCFVAPDLSYAGKVAFAAVVYIITGMLFTMYDVPLWSMIPAITNEPHERNKYIASARFFTVFAMVLASSLALPIIQSLGGGESVENMKKGYPIFMAIVGVVSVIFAFIAFKSTKETDIQKGQKKSSNIFKDFAVLRHRPVATLFFCMVLCAAGMMLPSVAGVYYMTYYLHRPDMIPIYMAACMGVSLIVSPILPIVMKKISAKTLTIFALSGNVVVGGILFFVPPANLGLLFALFLMAGFFTSFPLITVTSMLSDTTDYIAEKEGERYDGVIFSINSFGIKLGQAISSIVVSIVLSVTGYVANAAEQTSSVLTGINMTRSILPAAIALLGLLFAVMYKLPKKQTVN